MDGCYGLHPSLLNLDEVLEAVGDLYGPATAVEVVPLKRAVGRVLAETVTAPADVPPMAVSAVDGYGLRLGSGNPSRPLTLPVVGRVPAGTVLDRVVAEGEAVRIFTGAPIPSGVDTVVMQEDCTATDDTVTINGRVEHGANIRPAGDDMTAGAVVLEPGRRLRAPDIGMAAAVGRASLTVRHPLRVTLFSTGDELREPGELLPTGAIHDANRHAIGALLTDLGVDVRDLGILPDREPVVREALEHAGSDSDLVITSGGVSVGEEDHVKAAVQSLGRIDVWRLAIKPGKPLALGRVGDAAFLGLPGNPVSALVTFLLVGRPLLLRLAGATDITPPRYHVMAGFTFRRKPGRREFLRGSLDLDESGQVVARQFPNNSSAVLTSMVRSEGLIELPEACGEVRPGDVVNFLPFSALFR